MVVLCLRNGAKFGYVQQSVIIRSQSENDTDILEMDLLYQFILRFFTKGCLPSENGAKRSG